MRWLRTLHKWLGLIVGLQLLLWTVSGGVFAFLDHHRVEGEHSTRTPERRALSASIDWVEPAAWVEDLAHERIHEIRLTTLIDRPVWRVVTGTGVQLRSTATGAPLEIDEAIARELAIRHYAGKAPLASVGLHRGGSLEARGAGAVWAARFDDSEGTSLYFAADDGRLVATRNDSWRVFDLFWMLHTMDYRGRDDFNNPLVISCALAALWLSLSGLLLLVRSFSPRRSVTPGAAQG
jgi:uncharacterized iron-regulated membrane protein